MEMSILSWYTQLVDGLVTQGMAYTDPFRS